MVSVRQCAIKILILFCLIGVPEASSARVCRELLARTISLFSKLHAHRASYLSLRYPDGTVVTPFFFNSFFSRVEVKMPSGDIVSYPRSNNSIRRYYIAPTIKGRLIKGDYLGKRILDVGTGDGEAVKEMIAVGLDAVGIDIYLNAAQNWSRNFIECNAIKTPFANEEFDLIISNLSFFTYKYTQAGRCNYDEGQHVVQELNRILKPGGKMLLGVRSSNIQDIVDSIGGLLLTVEETRMGGAFSVIEKLPANYPQ